MDKLKSKKIFLYLTEFFSGMSVMAIELGASRLLAPYFSSSQIVWTIIIGTIMIALALGNIYGGKSADKNPDPDKLFKRIMFASIWIAAIPVLGKFVILLISAILVVTVSTNLLIWAALLACMVIFVYPLFLLGTVTPSLVKYTVNNLNESGKTVGTLGAYNTIGSIIGTFVPTFISIPTVGTSISFLIFSGILFALCAVYFISKKTNLVKTVIAFVLFVVCCVFGSMNRFAFWEKKLTYEGESIYNYLQVKDDGNEVSLSTNVLFGVQSVYMKNQELTRMYYDYAMAAPLMTEKNPKDVSILILGMGTGTFATQCNRYYQTTDILGVEIDEKITLLARKYFELPTSIEVVTYDGRAYLNSSKEKYDIIMVDAYQDITIPFQMSSVEFFGLVKDHLTENGVMVVNMNMRAKKSGNINEYLQDTISAVFPNVYTVDVESSTNRELFASTGENMFLNLQSNLKHVNDYPLKRLMSEVNYSAKKHVGGKKIMTDDKAPVELLGMSAIDEIIVEELAYYKQIFKEKGIRGFFE